MRKQWFASEATPPTERMPMLAGMDGQPKMAPNAMHVRLERLEPSDRSFL